MASNYAAGQGEGLLCPLGRVAACAVGGVDFFGGVESGAEIGGWGDRFVVDVHQAWEVGAVGHRLSAAC